MWKSATSNRHDRVFAVAALAAGCMNLACHAARDEVRSLSDERRAQFKLDHFYQKCLDLDGLSVLGSARVSDSAVREAAWIVRRMLTARPEILDVLKDNGVHFVVMACNEYTTDVPEPAD